MNHYINKKTFIHSKEKISGLLHSKTVRNGGLFSIFSFFNRGVSFVLMVFLARYIDPEPYGELSILNTVIMFLGYVIGLSTSGYMSISFFKNDRENFNKDFTGICAITIATASLITCLFVLFHNPLSRLLKVSVPFLYIGLVISFINIFVNLNLNYYRVQEKVSKYGLLSCSFAIVNFVLSLYLVIVAKQNWEGRVYADFITNLLSGLVAVVCFVKSGLFDFSIDWNRCKNIILWGLPMIPHMASNWIKQGLDRYIIEGSHTMADVGVFSFALSLSSIIIMVGTAFNLTNSVNLYQTLSSNISNKDKLSSLQRKEKYFSLLYLGVSVLIVIVGCVAVPFFMPNYASCLPYFIILTIYGFLQCIYFLYCNYLFYYSKTKNLMYITFGSSILHLILSLLLTRFSLYCTCCIYVVSQICICSFVYRESRLCKKAFLCKNN